MSKNEPDLWRNCLDTPGVIALTLLCLLLSLIKALDELGQSKEIGDPKGSSTRSKYDRGIWRYETGPSRWERSDALRSLVKGDAIFPPIVTVVENLKLFAVQWMEGMSYGENSFR
jgi:hypothetical protein